MRSGQWTVPRADNSTNTRKISTTDRAVGYWIRTDSVRRLGSWAVGQGKRQQKDTKYFVRCIKDIRGGSGFAIGSGGRVAPEKNSCGAFVPCSSRFALLAAGAVACRGYHSSTGCR